MPRTSRTFCFALAVFASLIGGSRLFAAPRSGSTQVKADLFANAKSIEPGKPFDVAVRLAIDSGWHVYWLNPGESGTPTEVAWHLPEGFTAGPLQFPTPRKINQAGVIAFGYEEEVLLLATITPPKDLPPDAGNVTLSADVDWLVCKEVCIPGKANVTLALPVTTHAQPADVKVVRQIELARKSVPSARPDDGGVVGSASAKVQHSMSAGKGGIRITVRWRDPKVVPDQLDWFPPPSESILFTPPTITTDRGVTTITANYRALDPSALADAADMISVVSYHPSTVAGEVRGLTVPLDLTPEKPTTAPADAPAPTTAPALRGTAPRAK